MKRKIGLAHKVTVVFVSFTAVLLAVVGSLAYYSGRAALEEATVADLLSKAIEKETVLNRWLEERQKDIVVIAAMPHVADDLVRLAAAGAESAAGRAAHDRLAGEFRLFIGQNMSNLFVMAPQTGKIIVSTNPHDEGKFKEDRAYFIHGKSGPFVRGPYNSVDLGVPAITIAAPVRSPDGRLLGVLAGHLNLNEMSAVISPRTGPYQTDDSYLVNRSNLFVTQPRFLSDPAVLRRGIHTEAVKRGLKGENGHLFARDYRDVPTITVYRWLPTRHLCLVVERNENEAFAHSLTFGKIIILISLLALLVTSLVAIELARTITRPLIALQFGAARLGRGETDVRLDDSAGDELGNLAREFNRMAAAVSQREAALRESEERYRTLFNSASDGIFIMSVDGKLIAVNESFARIHGYSAQEMKNMSLRDLDTEGTAQLIPERMHRMLAGEALTFEVEHYHKDGHVFPLEVSASKLSSGGQSYIMSIHRDIATRKKAEEEKRRIEERLQRAERMEALGILAGGVAHDLNNVLGVLYGYTELLLEKIPEGSPLRTYVDNILSSGEKGAAIIQDLLTLARRGVSIHDVTNINRIVSDFFRSPVFQKLEASHPRVFFKKELSGDLLNIKGSAVHLEKTVMNLLSNAAEAISGNGEVTVHTENRYLDRPVHGYDAVKEGEYVVLTVMDTGKGISAADIGKIFEPFYTKKVMGRSGTGLGLTIVWGTVKDHDGYIDVSSEKGKGTSFTLYFPVTREDWVEKKEKMPIEQYMGRGESILVVDDTAEQRDIAARILTRLGYQVHTVSGGEEAVEYLKSHKADLLILDMIMDPGIDGLETYKRVLEVTPTQKAIIVSGFSETERVKQTRDLGAGAYVTKPYLMEKIGVAIRDELRKV